MDWSGVDYLWIIVMFLSAVWTLILTAPIHCRASIAETVMQCYISPNLMKKQTHFWVNYSFNFVSDVSPKILSLYILLLSNYCLYYVHFFLLRTFRRNDCDKVDIWNKRKAMSFREQTLRNIMFLWTCVSYKCVTQMLWESWVYLCLHGLMSSYPPRFKIFHNML